MENKEEGFASPTMESLRMLFSVRAEELTPVVDGYLSQFVKGSVCPECDSDLEHTFCCPVDNREIEGQCVNCGWPARVHHEIVDYDGEKILTIKKLPLAYQPTHRKTDQ